MKEIVSRLHENRQIQLAKEIMESAGYKVTQKMNEATDSEWTYWEMPQGYKGPFEYPHYYKEYSEDVTGYVYPPYESSTPHIQSVDTYTAELYSEAKDLLEGPKEFSTQEEAQKYLDKIAKKYVGTDKAIKAQYAVLKSDEEYAGAPCMSYEEARELAAQDESRQIFKLVAVE